MSRSLGYWLLLVALVVGASAFACSSDDNDDGDGANGKPTATVEAPGDGETDGGDNGNADGGDGSGDVSEQLRNLAGEFGITEVKVQYNFSSSGGGTDNFEGTMTLYSKPPDSWRMDIGSPDGDISMINSGGTSYICSSDGSVGQCFESPVDEALPIPFLSIFTDPSELTDLIDTSLGDVNVDESSRDIAGQSAACFSVSGTISGEEGEAEYCFRDDGVLLLLTGTGADIGGTGSFSLEATSVDDSVSDSDFEPPYEILDIGDIGDLVP